MSKDLNHYSATILQDYMPVPFLKAFFFKKGTVFQTKKIHKIMGTVLLVSITHQSGAFLFLQNSKRAPAQGGKENEKRSVF